MKLPTSWKQISLKTFSELDSIIRNDRLNSNEKDLAILSLLSGKSNEEIQALPFKTRNKYLKQIQFLNKLDMARKGVPKFLMIKGKLFRLTLNATELSGGQYIDLMNFLKDPDATTKNIHNVLAVIALSMKFGLIKTRYDGKNHATRAKFFYENMPVSIAYPILVFFCNLSVSLTSATADYLKTETRKKMNEISRQMQDIMSVSAG